MLIDVFDNGEIVKVDIDPIYLHYTERKNLEPIFKDGFLGKAGDFMPVFCINYTLARKFKILSSLKVPGLLKSDSVCLVFSANPALFKHYPEDACGIYQGGKPVRIPIAHQDTVILSVQESFEFLDF